MQNTQHKILWRMQMAAEMARNSTDLQMAYAGGALDSGRCTDSQLIIELEREYFLNRRQATNILEAAKNA
jgi:hypothetical protein